MYRKTIEHPDYLPEEVRKRTDFEGGKTTGRVWRVVRDDAKPKKLQRLRLVDLSRESTSQLCYILRDRDGWLRATAHRLLLERRDPLAVEPLRGYVESQAGAAPAACGRYTHCTCSTPSTPCPTTCSRIALRHRAPGPRERPSTDRAAFPEEPRLARRRPAVRSRLERPRPVPGGDHFGRVSWRGSARARRRMDRCRARPCRRAGRRGPLGARRVFSALAGRELAFLSALRERPRGSDILSPDLLVEFGRLLGASRPQETWPGLVLGLSTTGPASRRRNTPRSSPGWPSRRGAAWR